MSSEFPFVLYIRRNRKSNMGSSVILPALFFALICSTLGAEKVLFGEPAPISAEGRQTVEADAAKDVKPKNGRQSRVFVFPGSQQQDSRTHQPSYVIPSYETEDRFSQGASAGQDENRLLSLLPSFGDNGMQVGLDFKLPFFSIPYAKMFSALSAPSIGGSLFGSSSPYGSTDASSLSSNLLGSGSGLSSGMATAAAMAVTAALLYPKVTGLFSLGEKGLSFRNGAGADDFFQNLNSVLGQFNIDGESCMKVALCSLGNTRRHQRTRARDPSGAATTTPADIVEDLLNLPYVKSLLNKGGLVQARDFGGSGGDCDYFNAQKKCPIASETFTKALSSLA